MSNNSSDSIGKNEHSHKEEVHLEKGASDLSYDEKFITATRRKIDWRLIPILSLMYAMSLIDRTNLGLIRAAGMNTDLHLGVGDRYTIITLIFFVPYIFFELPSNIVIRKVGVSRFLGTITVLWGICTLAAGFVHTWTQLLAIRILLGILEAGFFPGCVYVIQLWYTRTHVQSRMAFFYQFSILAAGFSPILSWGISQMNGTHNLAGWRWIWIIEGIMTIILGLASYFLIVDFPDRNTFLTQEETRCTLKGIDDDRGDAEFDALTFAKFWAYVKDAKLWGFAACFGCSTTTTYAIAFFLPNILASMGFNTRDSQLLCAPPYVVAVICALLITKASDKTMMRAPFLILNCTLSIIGCVMIAFTTKSASRYVGVFIALIGGSTNVPSVISYQANNIVGQSKRAYASALTIMGGGIGGIIASCIYRQKDAPGYRPGIITTLALQVVMILIVLATTLSFHIKNKAVRNGSTNYNEGKQGFYYIL